MELSPQDKAAKREIKTEKTPVEEWLGEFLDVDKINPKILGRLELLNSMTNFIEEERDSIQHAKKIFEYYEKVWPDKKFTKEEADIVDVGLIFADIGKTGPAEANENQQNLIIRLFSIEGVHDVKTPISNFIKSKFPTTAQRDMELLQEMGIDPSMAIEKFWRLHSRWTLDIIEGDGVPEEDIPGAVLHHILEGDNAELLDDNDNYKEIVEGQEHHERFGTNRHFDRPEKLVVLLDKYDAFMTRVRGMTHEVAIERLRDILMKNAKYKDDSAFLELIDSLDKALSND